MVVEIGHLLTLAPIPDAHSVPSKTKRNVVPADFPDASVKKYLPVPDRSEPGPVWDAPPLEGVAPLRLVHDSFVPPSTSPHPSLKSKLNAVEIVCAPAVGADPTR